jgi:hypothetical protein
VVTVDDVRAVLARLPRSNEVLVRDRVKFRVGQIVHVPVLSQAQMHRQRSASGGPVNAEPPGYDVTERQLLALNGGNAT